MKTFLKKYWLLIFILILAAFLRFYKLGAYPALNADEASNAYDAYSLIKTGMDQHGNAWPVAFQSFNDFKPGLYVYLDIPFIKLMGLTPLAARLPGAIAGVLSVLVLYLLIKELKIGNSIKIRNYELKIEEIAALFLAISPWHIQFSRGGWEVNLATFFILLGVYFFLLFVRNKKFTQLLFSILFLVLSLYTYHAARVVAPLLGVCALILFKNEIFIKKNSKNIMLGIVFGAIILIPLVRDLAALGALSRVAGVGLFADQGPINRINEQRGEYANPENKVGILLHNKVINYSFAFAKNYASHFAGEFLFMTGDSIQRNKVPDMGEMYLFDIIFLAVGFIFVARNYSLSPKTYQLIMSWLLIAPMASSLTFQAPNALRAQNMVIPLVIISSLGLYQIIVWVKSINKKVLQTTGYILLATIIVWNFSRYQHMYWNHMSKVYPYSSQYGVSELINYVAENSGKYQNIFVTTRYDQPYILFLFYLKYPPQNFQFHHTLTSRDEYGFSTVSGFDKYNFGPINFSDLQNNYPNSLIIGTPKEIPQTANIVKRIYGSNGFEYFDIVSN